ncbi:MAG: hypothetical protein Tsb0016_07390 [Sphingomonadales bacterium]
MQIQTQKPPPGRAGASQDHVNAGSADNPNYNRQREKSQARLQALYPHLPSETLALRATLATAESVCLSRIGDWCHYPAEIHQLHSLAARWAARGARSSWPADDLAKIRDAARHALLAASAFADLDARYE